MEDWYKVENLISEEERIRIGNNEDARGDFASYKLLEQGRESESNIISHNAIGENARTIAIIFVAILKDFIKIPNGLSNVADLGGGWLYS